VAFEIDSAIRTRYTHVLNEMLVAGMFEQRQLVSMSCLLAISENTLKSTIDSETYPALNVFIRKNSHQSAQDTIMI